LPGGGPAASQPATRELDEGRQRLAVIPFEVKRRSGRFRTFFTPRRRGMYRFYVRFTGDKRHSRGRAKPRLVEVR